MTPERAPDFDVRARDVPREMFPDGRVRFSLGTTHVAAVEARRTQLHILRDNQHWRVLRAVQDGLLDVAEVTRRLQQFGLSQVPELISEAQAKRAGEVPTLREEVARFLKWYATKREEKSLKVTASRLRRIGEQPAERGPSGTIDELPMTEAQTATVTYERAFALISSSPKTQEGLRAALTAFFTWSVAREAEAAEDGRRAPRWTRNPGKRVELRTGSRAPTRKEVASEEQIRSLLAAAELYQLAYVRAFVHLGLRADELVHTRYHTDLDVGTWHWTVQARPPDPRCTCLQCRKGASGWSPKTKRSHRSFWVPPSPEPLRETIEAYVEVREPAEGDFLFHNPRTGRLWTYGSLARDFQRLCDDAGVRYGQNVPGGITLHVLRHTCITGLVRAGVRESVISELVGNTVQEIVRTYVHLTPEDIGGEVSKGPSYA